MFSESLCCPYGNMFSMTLRTLVEILAHLFPDFLWLELYRFDFFPAITTEKFYSSSIRMKRIFAFFPEGRDIYEISIGGHRNMIKKLGDGEKEMIFEQSAGIRSSPSDHACTLYFSNFALEFCFRKR